jgi:hypothetical protein
MSQRCILTIYGPAHPRLMLSAPLLMCDLF